MTAYYLQIKWVHIATVLASGGLFVLRGLLLALGRKCIAMLAPVRYLSYSIDTVLLASALILVTLLHQYPFVHAWLTVKVLLLLVYIVLGIFAFRLGRTPRSRTLYFIAALAVYGFIISVARTHQPWGFLARLWT